MTNNTKYPTIILTKPVDQNNILQDLLEIADYNYLKLPCLQLASVVPQKFKEAVAVINNAHQYDYWLFTSKNAVQYAHFMKLDWEANIRCIAIGNSTKEVLESYSQAAVIVGDAPFTSEKLLEKLADYSVKNTKILIFTGVGGRNVLPISLKVLGAKVSIAQLYQRQAPPIGFSMTLQNLNEYVICITSEEALRNLLADYKVSLGDLSRLKKQALIVSSLRLRNVAIKQGFGNIHLANSASDFDLAQAIKVYFSRF